jgi:two-component system LytT family response regulator
MGFLEVIIIDDEHKSREVLKALLRAYCSEVKILAEAANINDAEKLIKLHSPNLIFLDIEMPGGEGFKLLERFQNPQFEVIFVTSFDHYALRAIKFSALDYLLKPVLVPDLKQAVEKAIKLSQNLLGFHKRYKMLSSNLSDFPTPQKLCLNNKTKTEYVMVNEILYLQADINYTNIYLLNNQKCITPKSLKEYDELLCSPEIGFVRIHKSTIVNSKFISKFVNQSVPHILLTNNISLEVSRRKKMEVASILSTLPNNKN